MTTVADLIARRALRPCERCEEAKREAPLRLIARHLPDGEDLVTAAEILSDLRAGGYLREGM